MDFANHRYEYSQDTLEEVQLPNHPTALFKQWFEAAKDAGLNHFNAMQLATIDHQMQPNLRTVLLKAIDDAGFIFYTNSLSKKGQDIAVHHQVTALFFWRELERQVEIQGKAEFIADDIADRYFASRPRESQIGAWASKQSEPLQSAQALETAVRQYETKFADKAIPRPPHWRGYRIVPDCIEFWQGRENRLHDRIEYRLIGQTWHRQRLNP